MTECILLQMEINKIFHVKDNVQMNLRLHILWITLNVSSLKYHGSVHLFYVLLIENSLNGLKSGKKFLSRNLVKMRKAFMITITQYRFAVCIIQ